MSVARNGYSVRREDSATPYYSYSATAFGDYRQQSFSGGVECEYCGTLYGGEGNCVNCGAPPRARWYDERA